MRFGGFGRCVSLWSVGVGHGGYVSVSSVELRYGLAVKFRQGLSWAGKAVEFR